MPIEATASQATVRENLLAARTAASSTKTLEASSEGTPSQVPAPSEGTPSQVHQKQLEQQLRDCQSKFRRLLAPFFSSPLLVVACHLEPYIGAALGGMHAGIMTRSIVGRSWRRPPFQRILVPICLRLRRLRRLLVPPWSLE